VIPITFTRPRFTAGGFFVSRTRKLRISETTVARASG
jgi:hypothetical protein